ncbi:MAG: MMPL family transporter [Phycisphaerae bacterium]|jgi:RND superfamily putative drug exporter|nr:MMPL family transporter [Phycisphaerae bacterium]HQA46816.1 MMPL family transporter [Phycisphaerae bacterium]
MFHTLGRLIALKPGRLVAIWLAVAVIASVWAFSAEPLPPDEMGSFLPPENRYNVAVEMLGKAFPSMTSRSQIAIVGYRPEKVTEQDLEWLDRIARSAHESTERHILAGILSPQVVWFRPRLVSTDGQAAMAVINLTTNMISSASSVMVNELEATIARHRPPEGLQVELTSSAAIGRDYANATTRALHHTTWVTVIAVLAILILVYRSPVGALVPLISIGLSVYLTLVLLTFLEKYAGWEVSTMEHIFVIVIMFGAGVDYVLFWIARYRERLHFDPDLSEAATEATRHAGEAVFFSAITTMVGMCSLLTAELGPSRNSGMVLVVALTMALLAGLLLAPPIARMLGRALFWPGGATAPLRFAQRAIWPGVADLIVRHPMRTLLFGLLALSVPAALAMRMEPHFDSLLQLPEGTTSRRGYDIAESHFSRGQIYSTMLLFTFDEQPAPAPRLREASRRLRDRLLTLPGVEDVYSLDSPAGKNMSTGRRNPFGRLFTALTQSADSYYLSDQMPALRFEILINEPPFSISAMKLVERVDEIAREWGAQVTAQGRQAQVHLSGLTPYIMAVRDVSGRDQRRVMIVATIAIAAIVLVLIRDLPLTLFMVFATLLTYGATLKLTEEFFAHVMGLSGIDWKVRLIVFVIVVAVGQDYNIFLVSRLMEERRHAGLAEAVRRAVISTGSVISSCGIIMAATLGSLWAGKLSLLQQVGFALALGILIDTYFVRPILIPSFFLTVRQRLLKRESLMPEE